MLRTNTARNWLRFRLSTLMVGVGILSVCLGWVGHTLRASWRQERLLAKWHGHDHLEFLTVDAPPPAHWLGAKRVVTVYAEYSSDLAPLKEFPGLENVIAGNLRTADISPLAELPHLKRLELHFRPLGSEYESDKDRRIAVSDLSPIRGATRLAYLDVSQTCVEDVTPLRELDHLEVLSLRSTQVSDLSPLVGLKRLRVLDVSYTQAADLSPLHELDSLEALTLHGIPADQDEISTLRRILPHCRIDCEPASSER